MRKNGLILIVALLSVFGLSSCIQGDNVSEGQAFGVLEFNDNYTPVLYSSYGPFYSPSINTLLDDYKMNIGGCYIFTYRLDADLPENSQNVVNANGYYTVSIIDYHEIDRYPMDSYLTDTSTVMPNEIAVSSVYDNSYYLEGFLFMYQSVTQPSDLELNWNMSFDYNTMMPTVENGVRYFDVFVRATKKNEGTKSTVNMQYLNAYSMGSYLQSAANSEKSILGSSYNELSSTFAVRFNYASTIDAETQKITWRSHSIAIPIALFL